MRPAITIVIPTLNEEKYLPKLLNDLVKQTNRVFEIIIVDANSEDNTLLEAYKFKKKLSLKIYNVKKRNLSFQRNFGAGKSNTHYLIFMDADCRIFNSFISNVTRVFSEDKVKAIMPWMYPDRPDMLLRLVYELECYIIILMSKLGLSISSAGAFAIDRKFFYQIGKYDENFFIAEDFEMAKKVNKNNEKISFSKNLSIIFSSRRIRREGLLKTIIKVSYGTVYFWIKGNVKKEIYNYEKGGQIYLKHE